MRVPDSPGPASALPFAMLPRLALLLCLSACAPEPIDEPPSETPTPPDDGSGIFDGYRTSLPDAAAWASLSGGSPVKYLAPTRAFGLHAPLDAPCFFQDMALYPWHLQFLRSFETFSTLDPATYESWVVRPASRRYWGGAVSMWPGATHPRTGDHGVVTFSVYSDPFDPQLSAAQLIELASTIARAAPFAATSLAWLPEGQAQQALAAALAVELDEGGVAVIDPSDLSAGLPSSTWSAGEGYGTLRVVPDGRDATEYGPLDVLIVEQAHNEMGLVSALLTAAPQNPHSHINLRLQEKGIPSATVPDIYDQPLVLGLDGALVHVLATEDGRVEIEAATLSEAEAFWKERRPSLPDPERDLSVTEPAPFDSIGHFDGAAYGVKAAHLGELRAILAPGHRHDGFAIPFAAYENHLDAGGLRPMVEALLADPRRHTDRLWRDAALLDLRDAIRDAPVDPLVWEQVVTAARSSFGEAAETTFLRLRSSTNVEDLAELSGAGLYDSRTGCLADDLDADDEGPSLCLHPDHQAFLQADIDSWRAELDKDPTQLWVLALIADLQSDLRVEKPLSDALRRVWRSLWNSRAFEEREWYGIDHRLASMGIAVHPAAWGEEAEAVAVTHLPGGDLPLYRVVTQVNELGVVRPIDPRAVAEVLVFERDGALAVDPRILVESNRGAGPLWPEDRLAVLRDLLFQVQDHFAPLYPNLSPATFDVEVDQLRDGSVLVKQVRPYHAYDPDGA